MGNKLCGNEIWGNFDVKKFKELKDVYFSKLCDDVTPEKLHIIAIIYLRYQDSQQTLL